jgi:hypothetical protein
MNVNMFTSGLADSLSSAEGAVPAPGTAACPECGGHISPADADSGWQNCPYCQQRITFRAWSVPRTHARAAEAMPEQATCFFHPDKAFQACCQRCGRFVCALCDLQLGAEHVCPTCFERGRADTGLNGGKAEWRHRDVLYDSVVLSLGWLWIFVWPVFIAALPVAIFLHVKYRKAPRSYLIPRSGWRFWAAYPGFAWLPLLLGGLFFMARMARRH